MKIKLRLWCLASALLTAVALNLQPLTTFAQGTAFTYQGRLNTGTGLATGLFDFQFALYNAGSGGTQVGATVTNTAVGVTNGLFITTLDFGSVWAGNPTWLAISVRTNGTGGFTGLTPLQELTPTPYAITAANANNLTGLSVQLNTEGAPNLIGGAPDNYVGSGIYGATIGGGGATNFGGTSYTNSVTSEFGTVGGGLGNTASGEFGTVGGGTGNTASGNSSTVGGGTANSASGSSSTVAGGASNFASGLSSDTVGGGSGNSATGIHGSTVAGGQNNSVSGGYDGTVGGGSGNIVTNGGYSTIPGGYLNLVSAGDAFAAGQQAQATNVGAFVWADSQNAPFASTNNDSFNVRAQGGVHLVTSGGGLTLDGVPVLTNSPLLGLLSEPGGNNFFAGQNAGNGSLTGYYNTGVGENALNDDSTGSYNTGDGLGTLQFNSIGCYNSGFGTFALQWVTTGSNNTASGVYALSAEPTYLTGSDNTADGAYTLYSLGAGSYNVAVGHGAMQYTAGDSGVVAVGYQALQNDSVTGGFLSVGSANTGVGYQALQANTSGTDNTALGYQALNKTGAGYNNVALGVWALLGNNGGDNNTAVGAYSFMSLTSGSGNLALGEGAGSSLTSGNNNIYLGSPGASSDNNVVRIGSGQTQTFLAGTTLANALNVDLNGYNIGNVNSNAVTFGISSGEGICSKRSNGSANRYDLELWTDFNERLKIAQGGNVGINTDNPSQSLEVNGNYALIDGGGAYNGGGAIEAYIGGTGSGSDVQIGSMNPNITAIGFWNTAYNNYMHIYCSSITIEGGADLAEPFPITKTELPVSEGEVVVIDEANPGQLKLTDQPYDTRVAGVVSGANGIHPGIQMQQQGLLEGGKNVALTGRVYVQADTSNGAIKPGDLLTTSSNPGRAMRVSDHARAQGAILGKAMTALKDGRGMVLVLVTLQ